MALFRLVRRVPVAAVALATAAIACSDPESRTLRDAPRAVAGEDRRAVFRERIVLDGTASRDPDGRLVRYAWAQLEGPTVGLERAETSLANFRAPTVPAELRFRLTVTDDDGLSDTDEVRIRVRRAVFRVDAGPDRSVAPSSNVEVRATVEGASDPDRVAYTWTQISGPEVRLLPPDRAVTSFFAPETGGPVALEVAASDPDGTEASDVVLLTLDADNQVPIAAATQARYEMRTGEVLELDGSPSRDPDGTIVRFQWLQVAGPGGVNLPLADADSEIARVVRPRIDGAFRIELTVTDDAGSTTSTTVDLAVNENEAPDLRIDFPPAASNQGGLDEVMIRGRVADPDGLFELRIGGEPVALEPGTQTAFTARVPWPGGSSHTFRITADDELGARRTLSLPLDNSTVLYRVFDFALDAVGQRVFLLDTGPGHLIELDLVTEETTRIIDLAGATGGQRLLDLAWHAVRRRVYVSSQTELVEVDPSSGSVQTVLTYDPSSFVSSLAIDSADDRLYLGSDVIRELDLVTKSTRLLDQNRPRALGWSTSEARLLAAVAQSLVAIDPVGETSVVVSGPSTGTGPSIGPWVFGLVASDGPNAFVVQSREVLRVDLRSGNRARLATGLTGSDAAFDPMNDRIWTLTTEPPALTGLDALTATTTEIALPGRSGPGDGPGLRSEDDGGLTLGLEPHRLLAATQYSLLQIDTTSGERINLTEQGFGDPIDDVTGAALDRAGGVVLLTDGAQRILRVDVRTGNRDTWLDTREIENGPTTLRDIALCDGRVFVSDPALDAVFELDRAAGTARSVSRPDASGPPLVGPEAIACGPSGELLVADRGPEAHGRLVALDLDTGERTVRSGGPSPVGIGPELGAPVALAVDSDGQRALVAATDALFDIDLASGERRAVGIPGPAGGPAFVALADVVIAPDRNVAWLLDAGAGGLFAVDLTTGQRALASR